MTRLVLITMAATASIALAQEPSRFRAVIDNFSRHTYTVELRDGKLVYEDAAPKMTSEPITITPSPEQWRAFRRALDEIGVWTWQQDYQPSETIFDGTSWSLYIQYPDQSVFSSGANCYPNARAEPNGVPLRSAPFRRLEAAVEALLGGRPFRSEDDAAKDET